MSRGFGTTFGAATSDKIVTNFSTSVTGKRTYSIWAFRNGFGGANSGRCFDKNTVTTQPTGDEQLSALSTGSVMEFKRAWSGSSFGLAAWRVPAPSASAWHHFMVAYDSSSSGNLPVIYIDGVSQTVTTGTPAAGSITTNTDNFALGNRVSDGVAVWDGMLAHFAIWDGVLLTAQDAAMMAAGVSPLVVSPQNLATYLPLDGISNPEFDFIKFTTSSITGTRLGKSEPPTLTIPFEYRELDNLLCLIITSSLAAYQQRDYASISMSEVVATSIAAKQRPDYGSISLTEIIGFNLTAYQRADYASVTLAEIITAALHAYQKMDFGNLTIAEVVGATLRAFQRPDFSRISGREIITAILHAAQKSDFAFIFPPNVLGIATLSATQLYPVTLSAEKLYNLSLQEIPL